MKAARSVWRRCALFRSGKRTVPAASSSIRWHDGALVSGPRRGRRLHLQQRAQQVGVAAGVVDGAVAVRHVAEPLRRVVLGPAGGEVPAAAPGGEVLVAEPRIRSEEHTAELQSLLRLSYAVFR